MQSPIRKQPAVKLTYVDNIAYYLDPVLLATDLLCSVCGMAASNTDTVVNQRAIQSLTSKLLSISHALTPVIFE